MARRKEPQIPDAILDQLLSGTEASTAFDRSGLLDQLKKALAERALNAEMDHHLAGEGGAANKDYDANHLRRFLAERGTAAVIPSTLSRKVAIPHDAERYRMRNVIERTFCRIKDFRGIATRYDKTARNFLAAVCLVSYPAQEVLTLGY